MFEITIDKERCKKDGLCAMTCPLDVLVQKEKGTIPTINESQRKRCFGCGQCLAICPHGAITHSEYTKDMIHPIRSESIPTYDHILELVRSRRSKRLYKDTPVERDVIEKVLEAARFAPSGHNEQTTEFIVIQGKDKVHGIARVIAECLGRQAKQYQNPIAQMVMRLTIGKRSAEYLAGLGPEFAGMVSLFNKGTKDYILNNAPALVLFCADSIGGFMARTNANLAVQNATLAAETLGLGCYYVGFILIGSNRDKSLAKYLSLPETHEIYGALALGYPQLKFKAWPERHPAKVTWM
jgi:nitroreductase/NAD-dependent dihydropyrimidine dehydrogenase PreA subunit